MVSDRLLLRTGRRRGRSQVRERSNMNAAVHAGIYCRLSVEDAATATESESIQTQKAMLTDYCERHGYHIVDYYIDDGQTGTNFERPGFQRMIEDIEGGRINTVICKDLSRFGRNYYEAGMYLDKYFVQKDIRFIAPGDNVDSAQGAYNLTVPVLNMMNDYYARGISVKTKDARATRAKLGMYLGSKAPYGYIKDPEDNHHLLVDEEAAAVVRRIFAMAEGGDGYNKIARTLHSEGIPNPFTYAAERNPDYLKGRKLEKDTRWHVTSVQKILQNPIYRGMCAQGRVGAKTMHGKPVKKPPEEWIIVENTHEALVSAEQWEIVQKQMATRRRARKDGETQMFAGLLYCSDCGSALSFSAVHRKTMPDGGQYKCWYYMRHGKEYCSSHYVTMDQLTAVVLDDIRRQAYFAKRYHDRYMRMLAAAQLERDAQEQAGQRAEAEKAKKRLERLDGIIKKLLEQNAAGAISDDRFTALSAGYEQEYRELEQVVAEYEAAAAETNDAATRAERFTSLILEYTNIDALNARILNKLIDHIVVYQREKCEDGSQTQRIEIYYAFIGKVEFNMDNPANNQEIA